MKLELKHLHPYMLTDLKLQYFGDLVGYLGSYRSVMVNPIQVFYTDHNNYDINATILREIYMPLEDIKPILRPLSDFGDSDDLRKVHEYIGLGKWCEAYDQYFKAWFDDAASVDKLIFQCPYEIMLYFFANHYDVFGLIEKGLAVDINTL